MPVHWSTSCFMPNTKAHEHFLVTYAQIFGLFQDTRWTRRWESNHESFLSVGRGLSFTLGLPLILVVLILIVCESVRKILMSGPYIGNSGTQNFPPIILTRRIMFLICCLLTNISWCWETTQTKPFTWLPISGLRSRFFVWDNKSEFKYFLQIVESSGTINCRPSYNNGYIFYSPPAFNRGAQTQTALAWWICTVGDS